MAGNDQPIAVALDDATVAFRVAGDRVYTAVQQASLSVADGEFVAIVGPTGCGKSTLLNVAAGLLKPAAGAVRIFGQPLTGLNRDAGYLFQADALFPWKTAIDNVAIGHRQAGLLHCRIDTVPGHAKGHRRIIERDRNGLIVPRHVSPSGFGGMP